jgi:hypothetical protein
MDIGSFSQGYVAGWRSVTGDVPVLVPESPVLVGAHIGAVTYMVGFSRGSRDATAMTPDPSDFRPVTERFRLKALRSINRQSPAVPLG